MKEKWWMGTMIFVSLVFLFLLTACSGNEEKANVPITPPGYIYAVGEAVGATEGEAKSKAREIALQRLSEQVYVSVAASSTLIQSLKDERAEEFYKSVVKTHTSLDFLNLDFRILERKRVREGHYLKVFVKVDKETVRTIIETFLAVETAKSLVENGMFFTAKRITDAYKGRLPEIAKSLSPRYSKELSNVIERVDRAWLKIKPILEDVETSKVSTIDDALKLLEESDELEKLAADTPSEILERVREKVRPIISHLTLSVEGPEKVAIGDRIQLNVVMDPPPSSEHTFKVTAGGGDFPESIVVEGGSSQFSGVVTGKNVWVEVSVGHLLKAVWKPGEIIAPRALLYVEGDVYGYVEPYLKNLLNKFGVRFITDANVVGGKTLKELAERHIGYVIHVKALYTTKYVEEYGIYSVRLQVSANLVRTRDGKVLNSVVYEGAMGGGTEEAAAMKLMRSPEFACFAAKVAANALETGLGNGEKLTLILRTKSSRIPSTIEDRLSKAYEKVKMIVRGNGYAILTVEDPSATLDEVIAYLENLGDLSPSLEERGDSWASFEIE